MCVISCNFLWLADWKIWHRCYIYGFFSSVCHFMLFLFVHRINDLEQKLRLWGFSPMCVISCCFFSCTRIKDLEQKLHLWGFLQCGSFLCCCHPNDRFRAKATIVRFSSVSFHAVSCYPADRKIWSRSCIYEVFLQCVSFHDVSCYPADRKIWSRSHIYEVFLQCVSFHDVSFHPADRFGAEATFMRFFSSVCHFMFLVTQLIERFGAEGTFMRFFSSVYHFMLFLKTQLNEINTPQKVSPPPLTEIIIVKLFVIS